MVWCSEGGVILERKCEIYSRKWIRSRRVIFIFKRRCCDTFHEGWSLFSSLRPLFYSGQHRFALSKESRRIDDSSLRVCPCVQCRNIVLTFWRVAFSRFRSSFVAQPTGFFPMFSHNKSGAVSLLFRKGELSFSLVRNSYLERPGCFPPSETNHGTEGWSLSL